MFCIITSDNLPSCVSAFSTHKMIWELMFLMTRPKTRPSARTSSMVVQLIATMLSAVRSHTWKYDEHFSTCRGVTQRGVLDAKHLTSAANAFRKPPMSVSCLGLCMIIAWFSLASGMAKSLTDSRCGVIVNGPKANSTSWRKQMTYWTKPSTVVWQYWN